MRILITSDNHLGYKENDPIRKNDTFNTFEEILQIATREQVDFILQGGDLFDENKPSRNTYNKTMQMLRQYCLGGLRPKFTANVPLNTADEAMTVGLPVLCIHGNHDDPSGFHAVSPLDVLQSAGLVNYFGRCTNVEEIVLEPILVEKGCRVAIYGLGYVKDRVLHRAFARGAVRYVRPDGDGWYNILVVHQNRVPRANEYLPEDMIASFFNLVVYGHEHESIKLRHHNFDVIQCGSTVRTSLSEGERHDKYVYLLEIEETVRIRRTKLLTVRPFLMESIKIEGNALEEIIMTKLEELLCKAEVVVRSNEALLHETCSVPEINGCTSMNLPLLRLRIEIKGDGAINKHRLNQFLEERVANPADVLRITRKGEKKTAQTTTPARRIQIDEIYKKILGGAELGALIPARAVDALNDFVYRDIRDAFVSLVRDSIGKIINYIDMESVVLSDVSSLIKQAKIAIQRAEDCAVSPEEEPAITFDERDIEAMCSPFDDSLSVHAKDPEMLPVVSALLSDVPKEYTFIEERREDEEAQNLIKQLQEDPSIKRKKENGSDDDLLTFAQYL